MPSIARIMELEGIGNRAEKGILARSNAAQVITAQNRQQGGMTSLTARAKAQRQMTYETAMAIQSAKAGDDTELLPYQPTPSINPPRPRTLAMGYDKDTQVMRVRFRDSAGYEYYGVSPREWANMKRVRSPGRAINRVFNHKEYARAGW